MSTQRSRPYGDTTPQDDPKWKGKARVDEEDHEVDEVDEVDEDGDENYTPPTTREVDQAEEWLKRGTITSGRRSTTAITPAMDPDRGESRMMDPEEYDGQAPRLGSARDRRLRPVEKKVASTSVEGIIMLATAALQVRSPRKMSHRDIKSLLVSRVDDAAVIVAGQQSSEGTAWDDDRLRKAFLDALIKIGMAELSKGRDAGLGDTLVQSIETGAIYPMEGGAGAISNPVQGSGGDGSGVGVTTGGGGIGLGDVGAGTSSLDQGLTGNAARTVISVSSGDRDASLGGSPNTIRVPLRADLGVALPTSLRNATRMELLEIKMNASALFVERPGGTAFFVSVDEIVKDYNRQTDPSGNHCQWKCSSRTTERGSDAEIIILTKWIDITSPIDLSSTLTFRIFDDQKQPLGVEQDVYQYLGYAWDDITFSIIFQIPPHSITTGDRISIRDIVCTEDLTLFNDSHRYRAEVVDLTHIRVYAYRPQGPPFLLPDDGRHVVSTGGRIVDLNNIISLSIAVEHLS